MQTLKAASRYLTWEKLSYFNFKGRKQNCTTQMCLYLLYTATDWKLNVC